MSATLQGRPASPPAVVAADVPREVRRRPTGLTRADLGALAGSALASFALVWLIFSRLTLFSGALGFVLCWAATFLVVYHLVVREREDALAAWDRTVAAAVSLVGAVVLLALILIVGYTTFRGLPGLTSAFFTETLEFAGPLEAADVGGLQHAIVGSLQQVALAMLLSVPISIVTAVFLNEVRGPLRRPVRIFVEAMSGVPSIVAGLFIYVVWVLPPVGRDFSGFAAALALSILMLPTVTRTVEEVLRLVPDGLREASLALGAPQWRTTLSVVLPTAGSGVVTAVVLGVARAVGETAPLIMTSFGLSVLNGNPFDGPQQSLPLQVFQLIRSSSDNDIQRAWTGALVLIAGVLTLFTIARALGSGRPVARLRAAVRRTPRQTA